MPPVLPPNAKQEIVRSFPASGAKRAAPIHRYQIEQLTASNLVHAEPENVAGGLERRRHSGFRLCQRFFTSWLSDLAPVRFNNVSSFISLRTPGANPSPYVSRNVLTRVEPFLCRISPFLSRHRSSRPGRQLFDNGLLLLVVVDHAADLQGLIRSGTDRATADCRSSRRLQRCANRRPGRVSGQRRHWRACRCAGR
jgi:hypothetical protein